MILQYITNQHEPTEYIDQCINVIFPYEIFLYENKRLTKEEDKRKLKQILKDIFNKDIPLRRIIRKSFKFTKDITHSLNNIAYLNNTCKSVSNALRKKLNKSTEFEIGEKLICRSYKKIKKGPKEHINLHKNYEYIVVAITDKEITLRETGGKKHTITLEKEEVRNSFIYSYCTTCHSTQGCSIDGNITIFDYYFHYVDRKWLCVAITRATNLENVYFYDYASEDLHEEVLTSYFQHKIQKYIKQDMEAKRPIDKENYLTVEWFFQSLGQPCHLCKNDITIDIRQSRVITDLTADRLDNNICHTRNNCRLACCYCNCSKK